MNPSKSILVADLLLGVWGFLGFLSKGASDLHLDLSLAGTYAGSFLTAGSPASFLMGFGFEWAEVPGVPITKSTSLGGINVKGS